MKSELLNNFFEEVCNELDWEVAIFLINHYEDQLKDHTNYQIVKSIKSFGQREKKVEERKIDDLLDDRSSFKPRKFIPPAPYNDDLAFNRDVGRVYPHASVNNTLGSSMATR